MGALLGLKLASSILGSKGGNSQEQLTNLLNSGLGHIYCAL